MIRYIIKYGLIFIGLVLFQALILNNIELSGYINPYLYVLLILILPFETPSWLVLIIGFVLGISVDIFSSTLGMHASATIFLAFMRQLLLQIIRPREGYEYGQNPSINHMGLTWFASYATILVFFHHIALFYIEAFKLSQFFITFGRALLSTLITLVLILISQLFSLKTKQ